MSYWPFPPRWIVPLTFCPNTFCPNTYLSQKKVNCPKDQKSQLHFVPIAKSPNWVLSRYPFFSWIIELAQCLIPPRTIPGLMQDTVFLSELSQLFSVTRLIVPLTLCPNAFCPKNIPKSIVESVWDGTLSYGNYYLREEMILGQNVVGTFWHLGQISGIWDIFGTKGIGTKCQWDNLPRGKGLVGQFS